MALKTRPFDAADFLETAEDVVNYLDAAFEDADPALIRSAEGNPELATVAKMLRPWACN